MTLRAQRKHFGEERIVVGRCILIVAGSVARSQGLRRASHPKCEQGGAVVCGHPVAIVPLILPGSQLGCKYQSVGLRFLN